MNCAPCRPQASTRNSPSIPTRRVGPLAGRLAPLEEVRDAQHESCRLAAGRNGIVVDIECVGCVGAIVDFHVTDIDQAAQRQVVRVAQLPLLAAGAGTFCQTTDLSAVRGGSLAVAGAAPEGIDRSAACRNGRGDTVKVALEISVESVVRQPLVDDGETSVEHPAGLAEIIGAADRKCIVVPADRANPVVAFEHDAEVDGALAVEAAQTPDFRVPKLGQMLAVVAGGAVSVSGRVARGILLLSREAIAGRR